MNEEEMVCVNKYCPYNNQLMCGHCMKGEEPHIYDCKDSVICHEDNKWLSKFLKK